MPAYSLNVVSAIKITTVEYNHWLIIIINNHHTIVSILKTNSKTQQPVHSLLSFLSAEWTVHILKVLQTYVLIYYNKGHDELEGINLFRNTNIHIHMKINLSHLFKMFRPVWARNIPEISSVFNFVVSDFLIFQPNYEISEFSFIWVK